MNPLKALTVPLLTSPILAQSMREPLSLDSPATIPHAQGLAIASDGDLSAAIWESGSDHQILLSLSDGRCALWSAPIRVDEDPSGANKFVLRQYLAVEGGKVYMAWTDLRNVASRRVYMNTYDSSSGRLLGEERLESPFAEGEGYVQDLHLEASTDQGISYVYVLYTARGAPLNQYDVFLQVLIDGIQQSPVQISSTVGNANADGLGMAAKGRSVYVAWGDDDTAAFKDDVYFTHSGDAGEPGSFAPAVLLSEPAGQDGARASQIPVVVQEDTVMVVWPEARAGAGVDLLSRTSFDGGATFEAIQLVADNPDQVASRDAFAVLAANGHAIVVWEEVDFACASAEGPLCGRVRARTSLDSGATFLPPVHFEAGAIATLPAGVVASASGEDVCVMWASYTGDGPYSIGANAAYSGDGGVTWGDSLIAETVPLESTEISYQLFGALAYNELYRNFALMWEHAKQGTPVAPRVGGFRPQTVTPLGWTAGEATVSFDATYFDQASDPVVFTLLSLAPGDTPLSDGRILGLAFDPLLASTIQLGLAGIASTPIGPEGTGATPEVGIELPGGLPIYAVGIGLDLSSGSVEFGNITDVVEILL